MERAVTIDVLFNQIKMLSTNFDGVFILVEGSEDSRLWKRFLGPRTIVIVCITRENVIGVTSRFADSKSVAGVIDFDAEFLLVSRTYPSNVFLTDHRDIEVSLFREKNLTAILTELGSSEKLRSWEMAYGSIYNKILSQAKLIGAFWLVSARRSLGLTFKDLRWRDFMDRMTLEIEIRNLVEHIKNKSHRHDLDTDELIHEIRLICDNVNGHHIVRGHDIVGIIAFGLQYALGSIPNFDRDAVSMVFRLSVSRDQMESLTIFRALRGWYGDRADALFV